MRRTLLDFWEANKDKAQPFDWLRGRTLSEAFVICIGAGPWKFNRRKTIQGQALARLAKRDISQIETNIDWYPLDWQNNFTHTAVKNLKTQNVSFDIFCKNTSLSKLQDLVGTKTKPKVISLFCRDALKIPSFPIDRHVRRKLIELGLPANEEEMIRLCISLDIDPRAVAVAFVRTASDMDNPDWSVNDC